MTPDTEAAKIAALADRCEAATGPDREIDRAIIDAFGWRNDHGVPIPPGYIGIPAYTASLDAAMTLVPKGAPEWNVEGWGSPSAVHDGRLSTGWVSGARRVYAATPALALCAAALRASLKQGEASDAR